MLLPNNLHDPQSKRGIVMGRDFWHIIGMSNCQMPNKGGIDDGDDLLSDFASP